MIRVKICSICREKYRPTSSMQKVCSVSCAIEYTRRQAAKKEADKAKAERKEVKAMRERLKTLRDWLKDAQVAVNAYIRERDKDKPCISCGRFHQGAYDAGHYRSTGAAPELRFHEDNIHRQCVPCNQHKSGNAIEYRIRLIDRIGVARVEWLEGAHAPKKYTIDEAKQIRDKYRDMLRELKKAAA